MYKGFGRFSLSADPENSHAVHIYNKQGVKEYGVSGTFITMVYRAIEQ
jgi:hypothetical protein